MNLNKGQLNKMFGLVARHRWLVERYEALVDLLFDECNSNEQRELIVELIDRFIYIEANDWASSIYDLALDIVTTPGLCADDTIIAAMAADSSPDSSQQLIQVLKVELQSLGWQNVLVKNTFSAAFRASKGEGFARSNIVLVDEFVGSGITAQGRCREVLKQFATVQMSVNVYVRAMFSSVVGLNCLKQAGVNFDCLKVISRGIADYNDCMVAQRKKEHMLQMEKGLSLKAGKELLEECSMGYGGTECLFGIEKGNVPNSVFPIFWWPVTRDNRKRWVVLTRWCGN